MTKWVRRGGPVGILFCLAACSGAAGESDGAQSADLSAAASAETEALTGAFKQLSPALVPLSAEKQSAISKRGADTISATAGEVKVGERSGSGSVSSGVLVQSKTNLFAPTPGAKVAKNCEQVGGAQ